MALKFNKSVAKKLELIAKTFWGLVPTSVEVTVKKTGKTAFLPLSYSELGWKKERRIGRATMKKLCHTATSN